MKQLESVESLSDVTCENCVSYDQGTCCKELPAIPVGRAKRCSERSWSLKGHIGAVDALNVREHVRDGLDNGRDKSQNDNPINVWSAPNQPNLR